MALVLATIDIVGNVQRYVGGSGVNANDVVVQTGDISRFDTFLLMTTAGAAQILATLDGVNYAAAPMSLDDLGAVASAPVIVTAASRIYRLRGSFAKLQVTQNGAAAVTGVTLICSRWASQGN